MWALIFPGEQDTVVQVAAESFDVAEPLYWVEYSGVVDVGYIYVGGVFVAPEVMAPDVGVVTMRQARLALLSAGLLDDVDAAIASIADPHTRRAAEIEWEFAGVVSKSSPLIQTLAPAIGLDAAGLATLFNSAAQL